MEKLTRVTKEGILQITDQKTEMIVKKKIINVSNYCKRYKKEIEKLLNNEVELTLIMKIEPKLGKE